MHASIYVPVSLGYGRITLVDVAQVVIIRYHMKHLLHGSYIYLVPKDHAMYLFTFENKIPLKRLGRQWCGIFHNH